MKLLKNTLLILTPALLVSCATPTVEPTEKKTPAKQGLFIGFAATPNSSTVHPAFNRSSVARLGQDTISIRASLELPEIEIPERKRRFDDQGIKLEPNMNLAPVNGNVCVALKLKSALNKLYVQTPWAAVMTVNGTLDTNSIWVAPIPHFDFDNKTSGTSSNSTQMRVCSSQKYFKGVQKVQLKLIGPNSKIFGDYIWSGPWPQE